MPTYSVMFALLGVLLLKWTQCEVYRLPKNLKPLRYFLTLEPFLRQTNLWDSFSYNGSVTIEFEVLEKTSAVVLHQKYLKIFNDSIEITRFGNDEVKTNFTLEDKELETYTIQLQKELFENEVYNVTLDFSGKLGHSEGFFKAVYYDRNDKPRVLAATHFEPTGARRAFPCFDEPNLKAKFIVSLIRKEGYNSVSNEELDSTEELGDGRYKDTFKETPLMATFTLAFAVSDYKASKKTDRIRIYARPEAIDKGESDYALEISVKTLQVLEKYTGIDFVIKKMDQIVITDSYFYEHAMENWGLVVYGESHLMRNNESLARDFKRTTIYIAHEFAHQWFGNLVTAAWWDYLWISESFAAYFQYHIADIVQPTWRLADQFVIDIVNVALKKEEYDGAYPLNYQISYSGQYPPFHIMYEKGASIIRMMEHFLTHDVFRKGLQIYLNNRKFKTAVPSDLYSALQEAVDQAGVCRLLNDMPLERIMKTWDSNSGFPYITVTRDYKTGNVIIQQNSTFDNDNKTTQWIVPINYVSSSDNKLDFSNTTADFWLTEKSVTKSLNVTDGWILLNKQSAGYYRVNYDLENWNRIITFLNSDSYSSIHVLNRARLISDAFKFAERKIIPWDIPLRLGEYLTRETDYIALASFYDSIRDSVFIYDSSYIANYPKAREFQYFNSYTANNAILRENWTEYDVYKEYIRSTLSGVYNSLGTESKPNDTHLDEIHRDKFSNFFYCFQ